MEYPYENKNLEDLPGELWIDVPGFDGLYQVSSLGRVKSIPRWVNHKSGKQILTKEKILSQSKYRHFNSHTNDETIALRASLSKENKSYYFQVRRLVYEAFTGELDPEMVVVHIDGDGLNNRVENLQMITKSTKQKRIIQNDRMIPTLAYLDRSKFKKTYGGYSRQKKIGQYTLEGKLIKKYPSIAEACRKTGCEEKGIIKVAKGVWKHHHGFIWKYE